jgi:glycine cleavage system regulatory protein
MDISLIMTVIGRDRPGLVESLSSVIAEHGGNWIESRMSHLAGQFAGILRVQVAEHHADQLTEALRGLQGQGLELLVHSDADQPPPATPPFVCLDLVGQDHPGIVSQVTKTIVAQGFNVEEFSTECTSAPMSGETLFRARAKLRVPDNGSVDRLKAALERTAADVMVDISLAADTDAAPWPDV